MRFLVLVCFITHLVVAQHTYVPLQSSLAQYVERLEILGYSEDMGSSFIKPYRRDYAYTLIQKADSAQTIWRSQRNKLKVKDVQGKMDSVKGIFRYFYTNYRDIYSYQSKDFDFFINPVIYGAVGIREGNNLNGIYLKERAYQNSRGLNIRGRLGNRIGYFTEVIDNQFVPDMYISNYIQTYQVVPGENFLKTFKTRGYDFATVKGYVDVRAHKYIQLQFGRDRNFWGQGQSSLILSDFATDYLFLKVQTTVWKIQYTNLYTQLVDFRYNKPDAIGAYPRKYATFHRLGYNLTKNINIGLSECVVAASYNPNGHRGFELQYLNPVIFYRSVEQYIGSPDNSFLNADATIRIAKRVKLHGQFVLDDYNVGNRKYGKGWWGNKYAYQLGAKYINVLGVRNLDVAVEYTRIRPYTFGHYNVSANYAHYNQYLGHYLGANAHEVVGTILYTPVKNLECELIASYAQYGANSTDGYEYGANIFASNNLKLQDYNNVTLQGVLTEVRFVYARVSYEFFPNMYYDLLFRMRTEKDRLVKNTSSSVLMTGVRINFEPRR
ncbi:MAG: capsule assembly Wzi family protein, partial [Bacteroidia bacterium]|nr:capsule assembly Wzi family protein [Bacteroidia bacterium]